MVSTPRLIAAVACLFAAEKVAAQCSDGSPPPCDARKPATLTAVRQAPVPSASDRGKRFLILPFRNISRQADQDWLVEGSTALLVDALSRWQGITVVPDEKLYPALKRAAITPGQIAPEDRVRRVAEETGGWTAVTGDVLATGGRVRITARAWDVPTSKELVRASTEIAAGGDVRAAFDSLSLKLLRTAGVDSASSDLASTTTQNLDAFKDYVSGNGHLRRGEVKPAIEDLQRAIRLDSSFALAWARLANASLAAEPGSIMNPQSAASRYSAKAVALSSKLPPREKQLVLAYDALYRAQFAEARRLLDAELAADSNNVEALIGMVNVEAVDFVLKNVPGGQRPRGSKNAEARLAKHALAVDPSQKLLYGVLASIYATAGVPGSRPDVGIDKEPTSFPDLMQTAQQREHVRVYYSIFRDSIALVPAESLSFIPRDTLQALRKNARAAARGWIERWIAVAPNDALPYASLAELDAYDHDFPGALKALNRADSLGVQAPTYSVPVRRMTYLARAGELRQAARLADSIGGSPYFANPSNVLVADDAAIWAYNLDLLSGRYARAATLLDQQTAMFRMVSPTMSQHEMTAFGTLTGNDDPLEEPGISRSVRGVQLDSLLSHITDVAASKVGPWLPMLLPEIGKDADTTQARLSDVLEGADRLATAGQTGLAFEIAQAVVASDSLLEPDAAKLAWYRQPAEAYNAMKRETAARFHPTSATIGPDRAVFEWKVDDATPFMRNRAETRAGGTEYRWDVNMNSADRAYRIVAAGETRAPGAPPTASTLSELLPPTANKGFFVGRPTPDGGQTAGRLLQNVPVRAEFAPGVLRLTVTDKATLDEIRRTHPTDAIFRFEPCIRAVGSTAKLDCSEVKLPIVYR